MRWWLSFAREGDGKNIGVSIVQGADIGEAARNAWVYGCNPGGQVMGMALPDDGSALTKDPSYPPMSVCNRALTPDEIKQYGGDPKDPRSKELIEEHGQLICEECGEANCRSHE